MEEFYIKQISNGWILQGPSDTADMTTGREIFLPDILAVSNTLVLWERGGFMKAFAEARKKYGGIDGK